MSDTSPELGFDLDLDLSEVDTSRPSIAVGKVDCTIKEVKVSPWQSNPENKSLVLVLVTDNIEIDTKGNDLQPNFQMNVRVNLQQGYNGAGEPVGDWKRDIARTIDAIFPDDEPRPRLNSETMAEMVGKQVTAVIKARKDSSDGYGETEVKWIEAAV